MISPQIPAIPQSTTTTERDLAEIPKQIKSKHFTKSTHFISRRRPTGFQPGTLQQTAAHQQTAIPFNDQ